MQACTRKTGFDRTNWTLPPGWLIPLPHVQCHECPVSTGPELKLWHYEASTLDGQGKNYQLALSWNFDIMRRQHWMGKGRTIWGGIPSMVVIFKSTNRWKRYCNIFYIPQNRRVLCKQLARTRMRTHWRNLHRLKNSLQKTHPGPNHHQSHHPLPLQLCGKHLASLEWL